MPSADEARATKPHDSCENYGGALEVFSIPVAKSQSGSEGLVSFFRDRQARHFTVVLMFSAIGLVACGEPPVAPANTPLPPPVAIPITLSIGMDSVTGAVVETDKDDYAPGEIVHVRGRGWSAGETVNLYLQEEPDTHEDVSTDVTADSAGNFSVHFYDVQEHDLGVTFTLKATGNTSGSVAIAVFTDGLVTMMSNVAAPGPTGSIRRYPSSSICSPSSPFQSVTSGPVNTSGGISKFILGGSARIGVQTAVPGYRFSHWSVSGTYTLVQLSSLRDAVICVRSVSAVFTAIFTPEAGTTPPGDDVAVQPIDGTTGQMAPVELTFDNVTSGGTTNVTSGTVGSGSGGPPAPGGFRLGNPPTYYDVQTTAVFTGSVTLCFDYSGASYGNENNLKLLHYENGVWTDVTTTLDTTNDTICGTVTSLSPFLVAEENAAPVVMSISLPGAPVPVGTNVSVTASFTDANPGDAHTATIGWDDGSTSAATVTELAGNGSVNATHSYLTPGVYTIDASVSDGDLTGTRSSTSDQPAYIVVYDPTDGFVTGGGWIDSPNGACLWSGCAADGSTIGKASFGFVSRYKKGATVPTGNTEFQFKAASLTFRSTHYQWLVIAGARAQYKGEGQIAGDAATYGFLITAIDGALPGGGGTDRFRIKLWNVDTGEIVYDNQVGQLDDSDAATAIGGGSVVIHK